MKQKEEYRDYEERLEEPYKRFEKILAQYDKEEYSELLELSNEITSQTASVYMEIGLQVGVLLMKDMIANMSSDVGSELWTMKKQLHESGKEILEILYKERIEKSLQEVMKKDKQYQKVNCETRRKIKEIDKTELSKEIWEVVDEALSAMNERSSEYGTINAKVIYDNGWTFCILITPMMRLQKSRYIQVLF